MSTLTPTLTNVSECPYCCHCMESMNLLDHITNKCSIALLLTSTSPIPETTITTTMSTDDENEKKEDANITSTHPLQPQLFHKSIQEAEEVLKKINDIANDDNNHKVDKKWVLHLLKTLRDCHELSCDEIHSHYLQQIEDIKSNHAKEMKQQANEFSEICIQLEHTTQLLSKEQNDQLNMLRTEEMLKREDEQQMFEQEKNKLQQEKDKEIEHYRQLSLNMQHKLDNSTSKGDMLLEEIEAMTQNKRMVVHLKPSMQYDESRQLYDVHFRLVESQFLRLTKQRRLKVTQVDYHINPTLWNRYKTFCEELKKKSKNGTIVETLVFHGTSNEGMNGILEKGFLIGGQDIPIATGQVYGVGVYTSQSPTFAMKYIKNGTRQLLFARVCISDDTKIHPVNASIDGSNNNNVCVEQLICKHVEQVLPLYVVHFSDPAHDVSSTSSSSSIPRTRGAFRNRNLA